MPSREGEAEEEDLLEKGGKPRAREAASLTVADFMPVSAGEAKHTLTVGP